MLCILHDYLEVCGPRCKKSMKAGPPAFFGTCFMHMGGVFERGEKRKEKEEEIQHNYTLLNSNAIGVD